MREIKTNYYVIILKIDFKLNKLNINNNKFLILNFIKK